MWAILEDASRCSAQIEPSSAITIRFSHNGRRKYNPAIVFFSRFAPRGDCLAAPLLSLPKGTPDSSASGSGTQQETKYDGVLTTKRMSLSAWEWVKEFAS